MLHGCNGSCPLTKKERGAAEAAEAEATTTEAAAAAAAANTSEWHISQTSPIPPVPIAIEGTAIATEAIPASSSAATVSSLHKQGALPKLAEMADVLREELGLQGSIDDVVDEALHVTAKGPSITDQAVACKHALGPCIIDNVPADETSWATR